MVSVLVQLRWLLWKNWVGIRRRYFATPLEFLIPAIVPIIFLLIRQLIDSYEVDTPTEWPECNNLCKFPTGANFSTLHGLVYYPDTKFTVNLMERVVDEKSPYLPGFYEAKGGFSSEQEMVDFLLVVNGTEINTKFYAGAIVFDNVDDVERPTKISYKIRLPATPRNRLKKNIEINPFAADSNWVTQQIFRNPMPTKPREQNQSCSANPNYQQEGFSAIQCAIDAAIIDLYNETVQLNGLKITGQRHPFPEYYFDVYISAIQQNFASMLMIAFFFATVNAASDVASEREDKLKETLKMMGVSSSIQWLSWIIRYTVSSIIICAFQVLFYSIPTADHPPVIPHSDPTLLFIFMLLSALASVSFAFMVSSFLSSAPSAAVSTAFLYLISFLPYTFLKLRYGTLHLSLKLAMCLISTVAMGFGGLLIGNFEALGTGANWSSLNKPVMIDDPLTIGQVFGMLVVDIILYSAIAFYVETVRPGDFGVPQPWYFPFSPSFWCSNARKSKSDAVSEVDPFAPVPEYASRSWFQPVLATSTPEPVVKIRQLTRCFGKEKIAVDRLSLDLHEDQITCLLGHNGCGKTTTMFMLTGFLAPTSGTAVINGCDIRRAADLTSIRQQLGLCPQHDVLFRQLTVSEHLKLFALLKGCQMNQLDKQVDEALDSVNLKSKKNEYARLMSGGQKRRLSVACALIGGSKVVILDEPTSGLDPDARRSLWDVIERARQGRTILLTTHFLEEADALADRMAVLSSGRLRCVGSPMFLKRTLGGGYRLNIEVKKEGNLKALSQIVKNDVPNAQLWPQTLRNELIFTLPVGTSSSVAQIAKLMDELEAMGPNLGMESLGLTASSIEDVFVVAGIAKEFDENKLNASPPPPPTNYGVTTVENNLDVEQTGNDEDTLTSTPKDGVFKAPWLWFVQLYALSVKHFICLSRSPIVLLAQLLVPLLYAGIAIIIIKTIPGLSIAPPLALTPDQFNYPVVTTFSPAGLSSRLIDTYKETLETQFPSVKFKQVDQCEGNNERCLIDYLIKEGRDNLPNYRLAYNLGAYFNESDNKVVAFFNGDSNHGVVVSLGAVFSALATSVKKGLTIETVNHPLPPTPFERATNEELEYTNGFMLGTTIMLGLSIFLGCCVMQPVSESTKQSKMLQMIAGASPSVYWFATFLCQLVLLMPSTALIVGLFALVDIKAFYEDERAGHFFVVMILFFVAAAPQNYLLSLLFNEPNRALVWVMLFNMMMAQMTILMVGIMSLPTLGLEDVADMCRSIFTVFLPQFNAGQGLSEYYGNWVENSICDNEQVVQLCQVVVFFNITSIKFPCCPKPFCDAPCWKPTKNYLSYTDEEGIGRYLVAMACQGVVYSLILLLIEYHVFKRIFNFLGGLFWRNNFLQSIRQSTSRTYLLTDDGGGNNANNSTGRLQIEEIEAEDEDIVAERRQVDVVMANSNESSIKSGLLVDNVVKRFSRTVLAVAGVSFAVRPGSVFGLLGFNGAGKSTLYRIITANLIPTQGDVLVAGRSVRRSPTTARAHLGYCPQAVSSVDGLQEQLTGRQQLLLMARLRGIRGDVNAYVSRLLDLLYLSRFADRPSRTYSGGMRRKLSTAVSLIGQPPVILLDEPTTGMDPAARRQFWRVLDQLRRDGSTVLLTSHSMDECDLLCDKIAVMVKGRLACIGSPTRLKARYGGGMLLTTKAPTSAGLQAMVRYVETNITSAALKDTHLGTASFTIGYLANKKMAQSWSAIFSVLERGRTELGLIEDYSLSHTTLERVFLSFAADSQQQRPSAASNPDTTTNNNTTNNDNNFSNVTFSSAL